METCNVFKWERKRGSRWEGSGNRRGHFGCSTTLVGHHIYVLGGIANSSRVCVLDLNNNRWSKLNVTLPQYDTITLFSHSANLFEDAIYLYGVQCNSAPSNNLYVLDTLLDELRLQPTYGGEPRKTFNKWGPADLCEALNLLVFCSPSPNGQTLPILLELSSFRWNMPKVKAKCPVPLVDSSACVVGKRLYVYGRSSTPLVDGLQNFLYVLDLRLYYSNYLSWSRAPFLGVGAASRTGARMVSLGGNRLLIFGGILREEVTNDIVIAEKISSSGVTSQKAHPRWRVHPFPGGRKLVYSGKLPFPGVWPQLVAAQNKLYVLGCRSHVNWDYYEVTPQLVT